MADDEANEAWVRGVGLFFERNPRRQEQLPRTLDLAGLLHEHAHAPTDGSVSLEAAVGLHHHKHSHLFRCDDAVTFESAADRHIERVAIDEITRLLSLPPPALLGEVRYGVPEREVTRNVGRAHLEPLVLNGPFKFGGIQKFDALVRVNLGDFAALPSIETHPPRTGEYLRGARDAMRPIVAVADGQLHPIAACLQEAAGAGDVGRGLHSQAHVHQVA